MVRGVQEAVQLLQKAGHQVYIKKAQSRMTKKPKLRSSLGDPRDCLASTVCGASLSWQITDTISGDNLTKNDLNANQKARQCLTFSYFSIPRNRKLSNLSVVKRYHHLDI